MSPDGLAPLRRTKIIQGVAAAAEPMVDHDRWMDLLDDNLSEADREALRDDVEAARASYLSSAIPLADRLPALRAEMKAQNLSGFIVPKADEHQGEYIAARDERLNWVTGFNGSAGMACVLMDRAALFVDGRYTLQAADQVRPQDFIVRHSIDAPLEAWLKEALSPSDVLGFDPWLTTQAQFKRWSALAKDLGVTLKPVESSPVDTAWTDQPPRPLGPVMALPSEAVIEPSEEKRLKIAAAILNAGLEAYVFSQPDSIAWLLNVRGSDVPFTPLPLSFGILHGDGSFDWVIDRDKLHPATELHVLSNEVRQLDPTDFIEMLGGLGKGGLRVGLSFALTPAVISGALSTAGAKVVDREDPVAKPKACKGPPEVEGMREAHRRDGAALSNFLCWLDQETPKGGVTEISAATRLQKFRQGGDKFQSLSFPTISGFGPNGAIVHYRVTEETSLPLEPGSLYLVDSGGQYLDGTTDVTRTVTIGEPSEEMRRAFTLVLKGHIALAQAVFPVGTTGSQLDILAREPLWRAGLDYDHGTGHGVGTFLSVHEGPQRISKVGNRVALEPGMVISNEPGYYKTGGFGIRIENLVVVVEVDPPAGAERPLLGFESLTLAPIDLRLVDETLLNEAEVQWLNAYHVRVFNTLIDRIRPETEAWLKKATTPIA